ncbi:hypothetical protein EDB19DRAFT_199461 [Suillus lakei]|nr:hypothetical protein EDB19DRAFT_199461 [Suillus lakei]
MGSSVPLSQQPVLISPTTGIFDIVAFISRVIAYGWEHGHARWCSISFTRCFSRCSMMRRRGSRGRKVRIVRIIEDSVNSYVSPSCSRIYFVRQNCLSLYVRLHVQLMNAVTINASLCEVQRGISRRSTTANQHVDRQQLFNSMCHHDPNLMKDRQFRRCFILHAGILTLSDGRHCRWS